MTAVSVLILFFIQSKHPLNSFQKDKKRQFLSRQNSTNCRRIIQQQKKGFHRRSFAVVIIKFCAACTCNVDAALYLAPVIFENSRTRKGPRTSKNRLG